jgi:cold-inducible RNA-binding protein
MRLYVGNLPSYAGESELRELFTAYGTPRGVIVIVDHQKGGSRGFGFIEIEDDESARAAIAAVNGHSYDGRSLVVSEAHSKGGGSRDRFGGRDNSGSDRGSFRGHRGAGSDRRSH